MRSRSIAAASMTPLTAQAASQNTLYVNGSSSACTDAGSGTLAGAENTAVTARLRPSPTASLSTRVRRLP
jgi:hypothetical protein